MIEDIEDEIDNFEDFNDLDEEEFLDKEFDPRQLNLF